MVSKTYNLTFDFVEGLRWGGSHDSLSFLPESALCEATLEQSDSLHRFVAIVTFTLGTACNNLAYNIPPNILGHKCHMCEPSARE